MRRPLSLSICRNEEATAAPFAVVAVMLLLGAGVSYAHLAHLRMARLDMEGQEPWSDVALEVLDREASTLGSVVAGLVDDALARTGSFDSSVLTSSIAAHCQAGLDDWVEARYPVRQGRVSISGDGASVTLSPLFGTVATGNPLGQQVPQRMPVGLEAIAHQTIHVQAEDGASARRTASARVVRSAPQLLAAYIQDNLELALCHEGLVHQLLADGLEARVEACATWEPDAWHLKRAVKDAVGAVQRSLFRVDTSAPLLWDGAPTSIDGHRVWSADGPGQVMVELSEGWELAYRDPRTGATQRVRLVPWADWAGGPRAELRLDDLWAGEAGGTEGARLARLDVSGSMTHTVVIWRDGRETGRVAREMCFRDHMTVLAESEELAPEDGTRYGWAQVEDWEALHGTMAWVSPPPRALPLHIDPAFGGRVAVHLDGVPMGLYGGGTVTLPNVPAGPHELLVRSGPGAPSPRSCKERVELDASGPPEAVRVVPQDGPSTDARYAFWYSLMAAFHRPGAGPLPHLDHLASLFGYPPLDRRVREDPGGHMEEVAFWIEGLRRHVAFRGGDLSGSGEVEPLSTLRLAEEVISVSELTIDLLLDLPDRAHRAACVISVLGDGEPRSGFSVRCRTPEGALELMEGYEEDGLFAVRFSTRTGQVVRHVSDAMSALAIIGESLTLAFDALELREAVDGGDPGTIVWEVVELRLDMAQLVISALRLLAEAGLLGIGEVSSSALVVVGAAVSVTATFLDAYREAEGDLGEAMALLLSPTTLSDALRTAGFVSGLASLVTTAVVTTSLVMGGASVAGAFVVAVAAATGVGLVVLAIVLAVWVVFNWDRVSHWWHGTVNEDDLEEARGQVEDALNATMWFMARLNGVDVEEELLEARTGRGMGLALKHLRTTSGSVGMVEALGGTADHHMDAASAQARRAKAVAEARHWVRVLWREADDLRDGGRRSQGGERSEGFHEGSEHTDQTFDFDGDVRVGRGGGDVSALSQAGGAIEGFLDGLDLEGAAGVELEFAISGRVTHRALGDWSVAVGAVSQQLSLASGALSRASSEAAFVASVGAESSYSRDLGLVQVRLPDGVDRAKVVVECQDGEVIVGGVPAGGVVELTVTDGALLTVTGHRVVATVTGHGAGGGWHRGYDEPACFPCRWHELGFGRSSLAFQLRDGA